MKKTKFSKGELAKKILMAAGVTVAFGASLVMPGLPIGLKAIMDVLEEGERKPSRKQIRDSLRNLEKKKIISLREVDGELLVTFRERGRELLLRYKIDELKIEKPKKWDRKWRVVIFDIPEKERLARDILRRKLKELGFYRLQKSVFVLPYECRREIELVKKIYEIEPFVRFIIADLIDNQEKLIKKFNL